MLYVFQKDRMIGMVSASSLQFAPFAGYFLPRKMFDRLEGGGWVVVS